MGRHSLSVSRSVSYPSCAVYLSHTGAHVGALLRDDPLSSQLLGVALTPTLHRRVPRTAKVRSSEQQGSKSTDLDDIGNKSDYIFKLVHVDIKVVELIAQGLLGDDLAALADGAQAPEVSDRVELRVGGPGDVDPGDAGVEAGREGRCSWIAAHGGG